LKVSIALADFTTLIALVSEDIDQAMDEPSRAAPLQAPRPRPVAPQSRYRNGPQPTHATSNNLITGQVKLRPVSDLRTSFLSLLLGSLSSQLAHPSLCYFTADMFRGMWRFGVFNAIQSTCFETVSLPLLSCLFCVARVSTTDDLRAHRFTRRTRTSSCRLLQVSNISSACIPI